MGTRRQILQLIAVLIPSLARAQPRPRSAKIGILSPRPLAESLLTPHIVKRLEELGYRQGKGTVIEYRSADGHADRFPRLARELIDTKCDLIFAVGPEHAAKALQDAHSPVPVVFYANDYDPLEKGIITSLSRPSGNITGVYVPTIALVAKRLEIMREMVPGARRFLVLADTFTREQLAAARKAADSMGIELTVAEFAGQPYDFAGAFETGRKARVDAFMVLTSPAFAMHATTWVAMVGQHRLPGIGTGIFADYGLLLGYGSRLDKGTRRAAELGARILQGAKVADVPVEQDDAFEFVVNSKTARALGIKVPESIRARATRIVQ
jgi:putative tryptophan/tyrosine transport system substrate-binding protein